MDGLELRRCGATLLGALAIITGVLAAIASANSLMSCGWTGCRVFVLGPRTPGPHESPNMSFRIHPRAAADGGGFHATADGFMPNEYVTIWDYAGRRWRGHTTQLPRASATTDGRLSFDRETTGNITVIGAHKLCLQGERSHRVTCATYRVLTATWRSDRVSHG
jgi:hypothetical protein